MTKIAFLGIGMMGLPMASHLAGAGHDVTVWNRNRAKAEAVVGATIADTAAQAVDGADLIVSILSDGAATRAVQADPTLRATLTKGQIWVEMASIKPDEARAQAADLASFGVRHLDAPVSGGTAGAEAATLAIMVGGKQAVFDIAKPILRHLGRPTRVGPSGTGQLAKLANQGIVGITIGAVAEAMLLIERGGDLDHSYSAQFYELSRLKTFQGRMLEMGRFCMHPDRHDPDIFRVAWGALTAFVDEHGVAFMFGCSSFAGTRTEDYLDAFAMLRARHLAPKQWLPRIKAPDVFRFAARLRRQPDVKKAMARMPPLLRTYLMMGGWVSDHAVVDHHLNTLHVFTGLEISAIPDARRRLLRAVAGQGRVQAVDAPAQAV